MLVYGVSVCGRYGGRKVIFAMPPNRALLR